MPNVASPAALDDAAVLAEATCPVCLDLAPAPILACTNGHVTCIECLSTGLNLCPQCRVSLRPLQRKDALEARLRSMAVTCSLEGCGLVLPHEQLAEHMKRCDWRTRPCPLAASSHCEWRGRGDAVEEHVTQVHGAIRGTSGQIKVVRHKTKRLDDSRRTHILTFNKGEGIVFVAFMFCRRRTLYAYCQQIRGEPADFCWSLTLYGPDVLETRHTRRSATEALSFDRNVDPVTTVAVPPPDDAFDLAGATASLPLPLENNAEALALQVSSKSMWCIAFRIHRITALERDPVLPPRPPSFSRNREDEDDVGLRGATPQRSSSSAASLVADGPVAFIARVLGTDDDTIVTCYD